MTQPGPAKITDPVTRDRTIFVHTLVPIPSQPTSTATGYSHTVTAGSSSSSSSSGRYTRSTCIDFSASSPLSLLSLSILASPRAHHRHKHTQTPADSHSQIPTDRLSDGSAQKIRLRTVCASGNQQQIRCEMSIQSNTVIHHYHTIDVYQP